MKVRLLGGCGRTYLKKSSIFVDILYTYKLMKTFLLSRYLRAFFKLMILSAVLHLIILACYFVITHDPVPLNIFSIIGANLFFPALVLNEHANLYSFIVTMLVYIVIFLFFTHENRRTR